MPGPIKRANKLKKRLWRAGIDKRTLNHHVNKNVREIMSDSEYDIPAPDKRKLSEEILTQILEAKRRKALRKKRTVKTAERGNAGFEIAAR